MTTVIDDFMSQVVDSNEKEKDEIILFLAEALVNDNYEFLKSISPKVQNIVLPFLTSVAIRGNMEGGEKNGIIRTGKKS